MFNTQADNTVPCFRLDTRGNRARAQNPSLTDTHIFSSAIVNEVRARLAPLLRARILRDDGQPRVRCGESDRACPVFLKDPRNFGYPTFSGAGYDFPSTRGIGPRDRLNQIWQGSDNLSIRKGQSFHESGRPWWPGATGPSTSR